MTKSTHPYYDYARRVAVDLPYSDRELGKRIEAKKKHDNIMLTFMCFVLMWLIAGPIVFGLVFLVFAL